MKTIAIMLCLALLPFALAQSAAAGSAEELMEENLMERAQSPISSIRDRIVSLCIQVLLYLNTICYRLTGGRIGAEAYCF